MPGPNMPASSIRQWQTSPTVATASNEMRTPAMCHRSAGDVCRDDPTGRNFDLGWLLGCRPRRFGGGLATADRRQHRPNGTLHSGSNFATDSTAAGRQASYHQREIISEWQQPRFKRGAADLGCQQAARPGRAPANARCTLEDLPPAGVSVPLVIVKSSP